MSFRSFKNNWRAVRLSQAGGCALYVIGALTIAAGVVALVYYQRAFALAVLAVAVFVALVVGACAGIWKLITGD
jgi:hypothetical protein